MIFKYPVFLVAMVTPVFQQVAAILAARELNLGGLFASFTLDIARDGTSQRDFTEINKGICPPLLCKTFDGSSGVSSTRGNPLFFQGDIVLDRSLTNVIFPSRRTARYRRALTRDPHRLWKDGVVVYQMDPNLKAKSREALKAAMKHISSHTCVTFKERTSSHKDFIRFTSDPGCWAHIGRVGGEQMVNIGEGCENLGTASHELLHALGIWHEQARPDRDKYVRILYENIEENFKAQFDMVSDSLVSSLQHPYDYLSVMHYSQTTFTKNGYPTIKVIGVGERFGFPIGQRTALSLIDVSQLREMYGCNKKSDAARKGKCLKLQHADGRDYRGDLDYTQSGYTCQKWTDSYPYNHPFVAYSRQWAARNGAQSPDGLGDHNKCRNPDRHRKKRPWCYTTKSSAEWGYCDVHICNKTSERPQTKRPTISPHIPNTKSPPVTTKRQTPSPPNRKTTPRPQVRTTKRPNVTPKRTTKRPNVPAPARTTRRPHATPKPNLTKSPPIAKPTAPFRPVGPFVHVKLNSSHIKTHIVSVRLAPPQSRRQTHTHRIEHHLLHLRPHHFRDETGQHSGHHKRPQQPKQ
ncbi:protein SpAN-like [Biomphalaria glabrata]|uniref:Metalloendopeptidase n=1 Tax=Biomphalaria glabrata TaxID=6526 RepID=A0A9W3AR44_BIOGL|nr:protein SpAN-like [Biomphalaria glabrata]XP_055889735.1 protein SpAN-like [Biomphalaria glabrata]XP_055889736.1 protein SpAN-like [Biomphalaria glabrata]